MSLTKFACPSCKTVLQAGALPPGSRFRCPRCNTLIKLPEAPGASVPPRTEPAVHANPFGQLSVAPAAPRKRRGNRAFLWGVAGCGILVLLLAVGVGAALIGALYLAQPPQVAQGTAKATGPVAATAPTAPARPAPTGREQREERPAAPAEPKKPALAFIAPDFTAAVVVRPQRLLRSPLLTGVSPEEVFADVIKQTGIDPGKLEQVTLLAEPFPGGNAAFFPAAILRFAEPVDGKQILDRALQEASEQTYAGKPYYRSGSRQGQVIGVPLCGYVADARTLLVAPETTLKKMLAASDSTSPLARRLPGLDADADVVALFVLEQPPAVRDVPTVRRALADLLKQNQKAIPPQLGDLSSLPDRLRAVTVTLNLRGDTLLKADLEATGPAAAAGVNDQAKAALDLFRQSLPELGKALDALAPAETAEALRGVLNDAAAGTSLSVDGPRVVVSVKTPRDLAKLPEKLMPLLARIAAGPSPGEAPAAPAPPAPPAGGDIRDQVVAWVKANNVFGPDQKIVEDVRKQLASDVGRGQGFLIRLGSALVKSGKQTYLCGMGSELYVFELTPEQEKKHPQDAVTYSFSRVTPPQDLGPGVQGYEITAGSFENAAALPGGKEITGEVAVKAVGKRPHYYSLRMIGLSLGGPAVAAYDHKFGPVLAGTADGKFTFHFPPLVPAGQKPYAGPAVFILEVLGYPTADKQGTPFVASNPLAALVFVESGPGTGTPPPAVPPIVRKFPGPPAPAQPAAPTPPAPAAAADMSKLQATLPPGWKADYNKFLRAWDFTKSTPGPSGLNESNRVTVMEEADPLAVDAFAEKLKEKDFLGIDQVWTEITERGKLPDGWFIKGIVSNYRDKNDKPRLGLVVMREVGGVKLRCKSTDLRREELRQEALDLCRSLSFGSGK